MKIHIPAYVLMAKCNEHSAHGAIDIDLGPDVVIVVRCKDCEYSRPVDELEPKWECVNICRDGCTQWVASDDFCSYGERRDAKCSM